MYVQDQLNELINTLEVGYNTNNYVMVIYDGLPGVAYLHRSYNDGKIGSYDHKVSLARKIDLEVAYRWLQVNLQDMPEIKVCRLSKDKANQGLRLRFSTESKRISNHDALNKLRSRVAKEGNTACVRPVINYNPYKPIAEVGCCTPVEPVNTGVVKKDKGEKMKDFSLSNLKDAVVDKVRCLDRKTITILALIALVLLVVGKYQTIKDILIGIKDKVKRSKNFKAMVEDGTNAINGLKKIIGIKEGAKDEA